MILLVLAAQPFLASFSPTAAVSFASPVETITQEQSTCVQGLHFGHTASVRIVPTQDFLSCEGLTNMSQLGSPSAYGGLSNGNFCGTSEGTANLTEGVGVPGLHFGHPESASPTASYEQCASLPSSSGPGNPKSSDPDWSSGGYTTAKTGLGDYGVEWTNLKAYSMTGVTYVAFLMNVPYNATGNLQCLINGQSVSTSIYGELFQAAILYDPSVYAYPVPSYEIIYFVHYSGSQYQCYGQTTAFNQNLNSTGKVSPVSQYLDYTTYNGNTGWLYSITDASGTNTKLVIALNAGSTSVAQDIGLDIFNPSIGIEVNESSSGNFLSDNSKFDAEALVTTDQFYYYGIYSTQYYHIGSSSPPSTEYASGLEYEVVNNGHYTFSYYDEFGTSTGINNWMSTQWGISSPSTTQTATTDLISLNFKCTGSPCASKPLA